MDMPDAPNRKQEVAIEWRKMQKDLPGEAKVDTFHFSVEAALMMKFPTLFI